MIKEIITAQDFRTALQKMFDGLRSSQVSAIKTLDPVIGRLEDIASHPELPEEDKKTMKAMADKRFQDAKNTMFPKPREDDVIELSSYPIKEKLPYLDTKFGGKHDFLMRNDFSSPQVPDDVEKLFKADDLYSKLSDLALDNVLTGSELHKIDIVKNSRRSVLVSVFQEELANAGLYQNPYGQIEGSLIEKMYGSPKFKK